jgi:phosphonopyruvate decarboxylase
MREYASKSISDRAKKNNKILNLSFGEPYFGPPENIEQQISESLSYQEFLKSVKRYESAQGSLELRKTISKYYKNNYNLDIDPENEIIVTHGGVEAITLAILCTSTPDDYIALTSPTYMLYERTISALSRNILKINRDKNSENQYENISNELRENAKAIIINSPENPSGYILSNEDWKSMNNNDCWIIHDEVYDSMSYSRNHTPAISYKELKHRSIVINSFSKKFGIPGIRIGWMIAPKELINLAKKAHDYLYLGVNIQYEKIANTILSNDDNLAWLKNNSCIMEKRINYALDNLTERNGFLWTRKPYGAMFLFPDISLLYKKIPSYYKNKHKYPSDAVAEYLFNELEIAVVPGSVYGEEGINHIRMVTCGEEEVFYKAIDKLSEIEC